MNAERSFARVVAEVGRRKGVILGAALVVTIAGAAVSVLRPKTYCAEARIEVGAVGGLEGDAFVARVLAAGERIRTQELLAEAVKKANLDKKTNLTKLAADTTVELGPPIGASYTVVIGHTCPDPDRAMDVVAALADGYRRTASDDSAAQQTKKNADLAKAEAEAKEALDRAEAAHVAYVKENREFLEGAKGRLRSTRDRKAQLQATVDGVKQQKNELAGLILNEKPTLAVKTKGEDGVERETRAPNEQWTKLDEALRAADSRLNAATLEMRQVVAQERELEEFAKRTPEHEAKAASLAQDESAARKTYEKRAHELLAGESSLTELRARGSLSIRHVSAPTRPSHPAGPGAFELAFVGLIVGAGAGLSMLGTKAVRDRSFHEPDAVAPFLGVPTLGAVGRIETPTENAARRAEGRRRTALLGVLAVAAVGAVSFAASYDGRGVADLIRSMAG